MSLRFIYFDLGKVILDFDQEQMCRQVADVAGIEPARAQEVLLDAPLQFQYERGAVTSQEFFETFCRRVGRRPEFSALAQAASDIFRLNASVVPVIAQLRSAGWRLGVLSNTCECHWEYCAARFRILEELFDVHALSYRIGAAKPEPAMFRAAAELAGVGVKEIFFTDDIPQHVAGARAAGFDAVQYTTAEKLAAELRRRGVRFNY